jgi:hypothetical protein
MTEQAAGTTPEQPLFFKWVHDDKGNVQWGRVLLMLGITAVSAYLSVKSQRAASSPDFGRSIAMGVAQKRITIGMRLQKTGRAIEEAGWAAYESARS